VASPRVVLGLGNPGAEYHATRHNLGFCVLDELAQRAGARFAVERDLACWTAVIPRGGGRVVLAKPRTYMNRSGRAGVALCARWSAAPEEILVVHDDADLELGCLRIRPRGSAGGHNGLQSLIDSLRTTEIPRLRLGVRGTGRAGADLADYVLAPFDADELAEVERLVRSGADAVEGILDAGLEVAMSRHNGRGAARTGPE